MPYEVLLTEGAEWDLEMIHDGIAAHDSKGAADHVLDRLMLAAASLASFPERGTHPRELSALGILDYRQVFFKPYRVIYRVAGQRVFITVIADGRRDMQTLLENRLLSKV
jgi:toxin ParE1/3/4